MATKAEKHRKKLVREGKTDPALHRGDWNGLKPVTRKTPTLSEHKRKEERKHKPNYSRMRGDGSAFYFCSKAV